MLLLRYFRGEFMTIGIISNIASITGIIGFFIDKPLLIILGAIVYIIETIIELVLKRLNSITTDIIAIMISVIICSFTKYNFVLGICLGLCIESVLITLLGWMYKIILFVKFMK